jgi:hypothetical protein
MAPLYTVQQLISTRQQYRWFSYERRELVSSNTSDAMSITQGGSITNSG